MGDLSGDICVDMSIDMRIDMCTDMCIGMSAILQPVDPRASVPDANFNIRLYIGIADGMFVAWVWACRCSK